MGTEIRMKLAMMETSLMEMVVIPTALKSQATTAHSMESQPIPLTASNQSVAMESFLQGSNVMMVTLYGAMVAMVIAVLTNFKNLYSSARKNGYQ